MSAANRGTKRPASPRTGAAVKLPLSLLLAMPLTSLRAAEFVATAASVATITKAMASSRKIKTIMAIP